MRLYVLHRIFVIFEDFHYFWIIIGRLSYLFQSTTAITACMYHLRTHQFELGVSLRLLNYAELTTEILHKYNIST